MVGHSRGVSTLQTLDRGLRALDHISQDPHGVSIAALAQHLGVHRAIAYRIVATLVEHGLVTRTHTGRVRLGAAAAVLSRRFAPQLLAAGRPVLRELARATGATSFLSVAEGAECVVVLVEEVRGHGLRVTYQEGTRHPLHIGAPGLAILAARPESPDDPEQVRIARSSGYSVTHGQLQPGAVGVSVGLVGVSTMAEIDLEASVGVVAVGELDIEVAAERSRLAQAELARLLDA